MNDKDLYFIGCVARRLLQVVLAICVIIFIVAMSINIYQDRDKVKVFMEYQATMEEVQ